MSRGTGESANESSMISFTGSPVRRFAGFTQGPCNDLQHISPGRDSMVSLLVVRDAQAEASVVVVGVRSGNGNR